MTLKLNEEQTRVVMAPLNKPIVVLAGPGSGKTTVLASRVAWLVNAKKIPPNQIVAVTFTATMASEQLKRIKEACPKFNADKNLCTIHAFCFRILRDLDTNDIRKAKDWVIRAIIEDFKKQVPYWTRSVKAIKWWIEWSKLSGIPQEKDDLTAFFTSIIALGGTDDDVDNLVKCAILVNKKLAEDNVLTFSDMVNLLWQQLSDKDILNLIREKYKYILVDEGQDTFPLAVRLLRKIAGDNFFIVGDSDQKLFGFTGADPEHNLYQVAKEPRTILRTLTNNYRSTKTIVEAANSLIVHNYSKKDEKFRKVLKAERNVDGSAITYRNFPTPEEEAEWVAKTISQKELEPGDVLVGARTWAQLAYVERALIKYKIPHVVAHRAGFFLRPHIKKVISYLTLVTREGAESDDAFNDVYNVASSRMTDFSGKWCATRYLGNKFLDSVGPEDLLENTRNGTYDPRFKRGALDLLTFVDEIKSKKYLNDQISLISGVVKAFYKSTEGLQVLDASEDDCIEEDLLTLSNFADEYKSTSAFLDFVMRMISVEQSNATMQSSVLIATIHGLKGLERDTVFGIGWNEGLLPHRFSFEEQIQNDDLPLIIKSTVDDERCTAFVLITRAKNNLYISSISSWRNVGLVPSRFLSEMNILSST